ncbi:hypothetical protein [Polynucleobacter sp. MWH-Aus1W21]|uniref:hypothetical protein n=1 Tax=Polynucleobacter sp. MWH-Aus1W21 TaxID=1855880 RepID=UPI001BFE122F|nr:hypothetical protein [Polynucleobacter sp. MWH-Aus1W21]QWD66029.1 hypothetical protein ICW03_10345 [Polynucleobacter sp. MWH-Aus1W21]
MDELHFYKGFPVEDDIYGFTLEVAASKAKYSIYESWFDVLKASPWYAEAQKTKVFKNQAIADTYKLFGDLSNVAFEKWWKKTGYKIFKERVPFTKIKPLDLTYKVQSPKKKDEPPTLLLEVPLHLDIKILRRQFEQVIRLQEEYQEKKKFDIYRHTTANAKIFQLGQKFGYDVIKKDLEIYFDYQVESVKEGFITYQFAQKHALSDSNGIVTNRVTDADRGRLIEALKYSLENTRKLIANATVGRFPDTSDYLPTARELLD